MSRRDAYHDIVRRALEADGWIITHDPLMLQFGERNVYVDMGAEMPMAAEKAGRKIAIEVKSFLSLSAIADMESALGQFVLYDFLLQEQEPSRQLYLAIPERAYLAVFDTIAGHRLIRGRGLRILVVGENERVVKWIEPDTLP